MKKLTSFVASFALLISAAAMAEPENRVEIMLATDGDGTHEATEIHLSGAAMDFDLDEMQVGENRSVIDESGRTILITRQEDGYEFNVDGKKIQMPAMHGNYTHWVSEDASEIDVEVQSIGGHGMIMGGSNDDILIISGTALDTSTQDSIRAVLQSAGHDTEVQFIDGSHGGGEHHVNVIKKQIVHEQ